MLNIILFGAPGCGKGTFSELLQQKYGLSHISTGDLIRAEIAAKSELGERMNAFTSQGKLVPDEVIIAILEKHLKSLPKDCKGIIFDGFPRTVNQAKELERLMNGMGTPIRVLVDIVVDEEELIRRILRRGETSGRVDDNLETVKKRLAVYEAETKPVSAFYKELGKYGTAIGRGEYTIAQNFEAVDAVVRQFA